MSASLVGSEMCIRDSFQTVVVNQRCKRGRPVECLRALLVSAPSKGPVSYTHLTLPTICSV
eukprot:7747876-Alexandrium_andersonii.AAC.1